MGGVLNGKRLDRIFLNKFVIFVNKYILFKETHIYIYARNIVQRVTPRPGFRIRIRSDPVFLPGLDQDPVSIFF